jgi:hypothetical protein
MSHYTDSCKIYDVVIEISGPVRFSMDLGFSDGHEPVRDEPGVGLELARIVETKARGVRALELARARH